MKFQITAYDEKSSARSGIITTSHGDIHTPIFMPVGTSASVKAVDPETLERIVGAEIMLSNTYHLFLRPGADVVAEAGGLHAFMGWENPILTDSGGYQVYSLGKMRKISDEGVAFQSHIDGASHFLTPENAVDIQHKLGADIIMAFDECTPYPCSREYAEQSMELTHRWLARCITHHAGQAPVHGYEQVLVPIVQGSTYPELRRRSAEHIAEKEHPLYAIGGLSVGEPAEDMYDMTKLVCGILPADKPRYLMGVGTPENLLECIALGVDMFDCVLPSRNARHGLLYTWEGIINIRNEKWKHDHRPIDASGSRWSRKFSRAYLRHLILSREILGASIATVHNLSFYHDVMNKSREHIAQGDFMKWKDSVTDTVTTRL